MNEHIIDCECTDFKLSWPQIIGAQLLTANHGMEYTGVVIRFCPWCGKRLLIEQNKKERIPMHNDYTQPVDEFN